MSRYYDVSPTKTCPQCGRTHTRRAQLDGRLEPSNTYGYRRYCSSACARAAMTPRRNDTPPAPCNHCGRPIPRKPNEPGAKWRKRQTCSPECLAAIKAKNGRRSAQKTRKYTPEQKAARDRARQRARRKTTHPKPIERRAPFTRFPTPDGIKTAWVSITGPELPPAQPKPRQPTPDSIRRALRAHPDLLAAIREVLSET